MSSILRTCILVVLIVSVRGNWEAIGERILNKISKKLAEFNLEYIFIFFILESGLEHSIKNGMKYEVLCWVAGYLYSH